MTHPTDPAFPPNTSTARGDWSTGLTKREYFAAMAMMGILGVWDTTDRLMKAGLTVAQYAVSRADALIAELNK